VARGLVAYADERVIRRGRVVVAIADGLGEAVELQSRDRDRGPRLDSRNESYLNLSQECVKQLIPSIKNVSRCIVPCEPKLNRGKITR
jgi:hypothetical protein